MRCRGFVRFPTAFVESGDCVERLIKIPAKAYNVVIFVHYHMLGFAAVFLDKANLSSIAHTAPSAGRICVGDLQLLELYHFKKNLFKIELNFDDMGSSFLCAF